MRDHARLLPLSNFKHDSGHGWIAELSADIPDGDGPDNNFVSLLRLFEDGSEIGPGHALHADIRTHGGGLFSHWNSNLYFSTSDNSSPLDNQRQYTMLLAKPTSDARSSVLQAADDIDPATLSSEQRYVWGERLFNLFVHDAKLSEHGRSFFFDREFIEDYERFDRENYRSFDRKFALKELLNFAMLQKGNVAECGVFRGASAYFLAQAIIREGADRTLHLFNSFEGLSEPQALDGTHWTKGDLSCGRSDVEAELAPVSSVIQIHPGWIPSKFGEVGNEQFCFVHVDVDLYQPTRDAIEFFYFRLVPGGVLVCDDYGFETCPGARRAMDEFFNKCSEPIIHLPTGQGVVIKSFHRLLDFGSDRGSTYRDAQQRKVTKLYDPAFIGSLAKSREDGVQSALVHKAKHISMLHYETLQLLWNLAAAAPGAIVEIGGYVGGATVVLASAAKQMERRIITIEKGGSYPEHPFIPSQNILADLHQNLADYGVAAIVTVIEGEAGYQTTVEQVRRSLDGEEIGLFVVDADGRIDRDFEDFRPLLADGAFIVVDDYDSEDAPDKSAIIKPFIDRGIREGFLHDLGVHLWSTWVGQYVASHPGRPGSR